jgi:protein phosphatase
MVDVDDERDVGRALDWWAARTADGWEGTVFKPLGFIARGRRGLVQPALKCRGPEYLRHLFAGGSAIPRSPRLHRRRLAARRALATRQFALGVEGLSRFVAREPLRRVHECSFGALALGAEPVDLSL